MPTILVADDNRNIHKMVESALKDLGYKVESVGNGEHAVQKLPAINPDLILADIYMPVRDGYQVCEFVKNNEQFAHIPVVLLQGKFDPLDEHKMRSARADGLLMKPFVPADPLVKMVTELLEEAAAKRPATAAAKGSPEKTVELSPAEVAAATGQDAPPPEAEIPDYAVQPPKIEIREEDKMLAFGDLLSSPTAEEEERRPKAADSAGFRASSLGEDEIETEAPAGEPDEVAEAEERERSFGGILEEAKKPSPDEPPIKVEFSGTPEPMELITEETKAEPTPVDAAPLPELATNPDEWLQAGPPAVSTEAGSAESWEAAPPAAEPAAGPRIVVAPEPKPASPPTFSPEPPPLPYEKPKLEELAAPPAPADSVPAETAAPSASPPPPPAAEPKAQVISMPAPAEPDPALVDAIVEKVVARLQPQVVDKIARELVRPIAEALLKKEEQK